MLTEMQRPPSTDTRKSSGRQLMFSLRVPAPVDARKWRERAFEEEMAPVTVLNSVAFYGHGRALNLAALRPEGNDMEDLVVHLAQSLADDLKTYIPIDRREQNLEFTHKGGISAYRLSSMVLCKPGDDFKKAQDTDWVRAKITQRLTADIPLQADAFGQHASDPVFEIASIGESLPVAGAMRASRTGPANPTVMVLRDADIIFRGAMLGFWAVGPLRCAGFGRLMHRPIEGLVLSPRFQQELLA